MFANVDVSQIRHVPMPQKIYAHSLKGSLQEKQGGVEMTSRKGSVEVALLQQATIPGRGRGSAG